MHESLKDLWWTLEYLPKLIHDPAHGFEHDGLFTVGVTARANSAAGM